MNFYLCIVNHNFFVKSMRGFLKDSSISVRFLSLLCVFFFCLLTGAFMGSLISGFATEDLAQARVMQLIQSVFIFILPPLILAYLWSDNPVSYLQLTKGNITFSCVLLTIVIVIAMIPFINLLMDMDDKIVLPSFLSEWESTIRSKEAEQNLFTERLLSTHSFLILLQNLFTVAIIAALGEELFFRGIILKMIQDWKGIALAVWLSALVFSIAHGQFFGLIPRLLMGAFLGYLLVWSRTIWLPVLAHFVNNAIIVLFFYFKSNDISFIDINTVGSGSTWWLGCLSGGASILLILVLRKVLIKKQLDFNKNSSGLVI